MGVAEPPQSQMGVVSATPILALGGGRTTPKGHGAGLATSKNTLGQNGGGWTLVLDGKLDGGTISVFSHTTGTTYDKK